ncbi:HNH endonuclease signature motif containing protein [Noviherbaspirillum malthae]|uniref:HNH endonuclease signature motif containing protein n=1 Tax=Noviherbaspirillum malthae TaxID=1260987 RepID=UPI0018907201|nr:HNH endonuclease signature motif containing protein [Noviherbaspirillum malthae]
MTKSRGILPPRIIWTAELDAELSRRYPNEKAADLAAALGMKVHIVYARAKKLGLKKSEAFFADPALSGRTDGARGASSRFAKGNVPWTQGKKGLSLSPATQFKKGQRPVNYMDVGSEKMHMGYVWLKVADGGWPDAWRPKHHVLWQQISGCPIPNGHMISFRDGDRFNFTPSNLELVSKVEWMKRNTRHNLPPEINEVIQLRAVLTRHINKRSKAHEQENH